MADQTEPVPATRPQLAVAADQVKTTWPISQPAQSLGINYVYLQRVVGRQLGHGPNPGGWDHTKRSEVDLVIQTGLRNFYDPLVLPGETYAHEWSFLKPTKVLQTTANQFAYDLPPGYATLEGPICFPPSAMAVIPPIELVDEMQIHKFRQAGECFGKPTVAAIRVKPMDSTGTRYEIIFWMTPDATYDLIIKYGANPDLLRADQDCPLGGQQHAQTIIEACLEAADDMKGVVGTHGPKFRERLRASIAQDRQSSSPDTLGYAYDRSDRPLDPYGANLHDLGYNLVTRNGSIVL